jgi:hypothetical protein
MGVLDPQYGLSQISIVFGKTDRATESKLRPSAERTIETTDFDLWYRGRAAPAQRADGASQARSARVAELNPIAVRSQVMLAKHAARGKGQINDRPRRVSKRPR